MLWIPVTLAASAGQLLRNGVQAALTKRVGTLGATQVRFVFGLPLALVLLPAALLATGAALPLPGWRSLGWCLTGSVAQIAATGLMLVVMRQRAFGVAYAYIKTEPVIVAVLGFAVLGDRLPPLAWVAVGVVTSGVIVASVAPGDWSALLREKRMIAAGVTAGGLFGLSAIAFRAAINGLDTGDFVIRSLTILALSLAIQSMLLGLWMATRDRAAFAGSLREWRLSATAGLLGGAASACWFVAFSLAPAAYVRTLALVEMPLAALVGGRLAGTGVVRHELAGMIMVMAGAGLLVWSAAA